MFLLQLHSLLALQEADCGDGSEDEDDAEGDSDLGGFIVPDGAEDQAGRSQLPAAGRVSSRKRKPNRRYVQQVLSA